jgi:hypothetical protein
MFLPGGQVVEKSDSLARIISHRHHARLVGCLQDALSKGANLEVGGEYNEETRFFAPTLLSHVSPDMQLMQEEIFGPILPVMTYRTTEDILQIVARQPKPLTFYIHSQRQSFIDTLLRNTSSGGAVINDYLLGFANPNLPFGGVNNSGIGKSLGFQGFKEFSNEKSVIHRKFGDFRMFFNNVGRFKKYFLAILIGLPTWYVIGILVNLSNRFAGEFYGANHIESGRAIMFAYVGIASGDIVIGLVSQAFKSRKKALLCFYGMSIVGLLIYFSPLNNSDSTMYAICGYLGFSTGFWAIFVTMGAEQFGTNLRATAATTIPNMVRGALPLINWMFLDLFQKAWGFSLSSSGMITGAIVMGITLVAYYFTEETFHKDLNYIEE